MTLCVVIPAYNAAATLAETPDGLLAQTRGDWTGIIVDDGSTDGSQALLETYGKSIKLMKCPSNRGAIAARNYGASCDFDDPLG